jgi:uncharacterized DUF497 family protein
MNKTNENIILVLKLPHWYLTILFLLEEFDKENSVTEERFNVTGSVTGLINNTLITVSVVYRGDLIRIFSARDASPSEVIDYYEQFQEYFGGQDEN